MAETGKSRKLESPAGIGRLRQSGQAVGEVEGVEDGVTKLLPFAALVAGDSKALRFRFRYFQRFAGRIQLPGQFQPRRVTIRLSPRGKGQPPGVEQTLEWPA